MNTIKETRKDTKKGNELFKQYNIVREGQMTKEMEADIQKQDYETAKQALELRKDLKEVVKANPEWSLCEGFKELHYNEYMLKWYIQNEYSNLEYELWNNGLCNAIRYLEECWKHCVSNYQKITEIIDKINDKINDKEYGDFCYQSNYGTCEVCGEFDDTGNGFGDRTGKCGDCQEDEEEEEPEEGGE